jgi:hypothetical protein
LGLRGRDQVEKRLTITIIIIIMEIMEIMENGAMSEPVTSSAALLEPSGIHTLDVRHAMDKLIAAVSPERSHANAAYGVLIYHAAKTVPAPNILSATGWFVRAYVKGWTALSKMQIEIVGVGEKGNNQIGVLEHSNVRYIVKVFAGKAAVSALKKESKPSPGVYINTAHLDTLLLDDLKLPHLPERFRNMPLVMQVEEKEQKNDEPLPGWENFVRATFDEIAAQETIDRDTVEWRSQFMKSNPSWTAKDVADQSTSTAKNRAALASRWAQEGKIFAVKYEGQLWYPRFQFQGGEPLPMIGQVIQAFPNHANGWDFAYLFATPNANIGGRKPLELLKSDPERVLSLARAAANPADTY